MSFRSSFCSGVHASGLSVALSREIALSTACCRSGVIADLGIRPRLLSSEIRVIAAPLLLKPRTAPAPTLKPTAWSPKEVSVQRQIPPPEFFQLRTWPPFFQPGAEGPPSLCAQGPRVDAASWAPEVFLAKAAALLELLGKMRNGGASGLALMDSTPELHDL